MGGGNGTLMVNVLDYIRQKAPQLYDMTTYHLVEISEKLQKRQRKACDNAGHQARVMLHRQNIFEWKDVVQEPCFFIAMEVIVHFTLSATF